MNKMTDKQAKMWLKKNPPVGHLENHPRYKFSTVHLIDGSLVTLVFDTVHQLPADTQYKKWK